MRINTQEALRYIGVRQADAALAGEMQETARQMERLLPPKWTWRLLPLTHSAAGYSLGDTGITLHGKTASAFLGDSGQIVLLACTIGAGFDQRLNQLQGQDMRAALLWDACGSAWVEAGCDAAEAEIRSRLPGLRLGRRFSPGYGDLPLTLQSALLAALDASRRLGLTLTDSLLMLPTKSVTALMGVGCTAAAPASGCAACNLRERCAYRRTDTTSEESV